MKKPVVELCRPSSFLPLLVFAPRFIPLTLDCRQKATKAFTKQAQDPGAEKTYKILDARCAETGLTMTSA